MKIKLSAPKRAIHLSIVIALVSSLLSFVATPANAIGAPYDRGTGNGDVACSTSGFFTISNNVVTGHTGCVGGIVVPYGVTTIGQSVFWISNGARLTSVALPETLQVIEDYAFYSQRISGVSIPALVTRIGTLAFATSGMSTLTFLGGSNDLTIAGDAFQLGTFTSVTFPTNLKNLSSSALAGSPLQSINFLGTIPSGWPWSAPANVQVSGNVNCGTSGYLTISNNVVTGNTACIGSAVIPDGVTSITTGALNSASITSVNLAKTVTSIGNGVFNAGTTVTQNCGTSGYFTISNKVVSGNTSCTGSVGPPTGVTGIANSAFKNANATSLTISSTVESIGEEAFRESSLSGALVIPDNVISIGRLAFFASNGITSLVVGSGITTIPDSAFDALYNLSSLTLPNTLTSIGSNAFWYAISLSSLTIPVSVTTISAGAFGDPPDNNGRSVRTLIYCGSASLAGTGLQTATRDDSSCPTAAAITTQPIGAASGSVLGTQPVIRIVNSTGGTVTSSTVNVVASIATGTGTLSGTTTVAAVAGVATFTNLAITGTPGTFTLTFTPTSLTPITSSSLTITANAARTPTFGTPTATADGFTVQISNYDAAFTWGGSATASGSVSINGSGLVTVTGVAAGTSSTATITTTRTGYTSGSATVSGTSVSNSNVATLSSLTISAGTLTPTFATGTYSYTASVLSDTSTVTVTPTRTQANATLQVRVNSGSYASVTSGSASGSLSLNAGSNTIDVLVTAQDGSTTATYTITVTRAAALAAPAFTLSSSSETATVGTAITGYTITSTGGAIASYSISPAIGNGLSFDSSTGRITGTPTAAAGAVTYTITARNASTPDATQAFSLAVNYAPVLCSGGGTLIISNTTLTANSGCIGSAVVPLGVTAVASGTLNSASITTVNLPKTVTSVGNGPFNTKTVLTQNCGTSGTFTIAYQNQGPVVTGNSSCNGSVVIPEGIKSLSPSAFNIEVVIYSTPRITSLTLPSTLTTIGDTAFRGQPLTSVTIPASVTGIGQLAFSIISGTLKSVTFLGNSSNGALTIGSYAFQYSPMTCITLPANLANLSSVTFVGVNNLRCVNFLGNAPTVNNNQNINLAFTSATPPTAYITPSAARFARTNPPNVWNGMPVVTGQGACITYSAGTGGTGTAPATPASVLVGSTFLTPTNTFTPPAGAYFAGWSDGTNTYAEGATYPATGSVSGNVTLTALWSYGTFTVTFQANGGIGSDVTQTRNTTANLRLNTFTRANYKFLGWNTCASPVVPYSDGQSYRFRADMTLCAQWGRTILYSTAYTDSGLPSRSSEDWISGTIKFPTVGTMVTAGYSFGGWSETLGGSTPVSDSYAPSAATQTLYPIWTANTYTISFNGNGATSGNVPASKSWSTGAVGTILGGNTGSLAKPGYTFGGWATSASSTTPVTRYGVIQNQTFFAIWTPVTYTITYDLNYVGAPAAPTQASQNIYNTFNLAAKPTRAGWEFGGWSDTATAYAELAPYTITANTPTALTLSAQWVPYFTVQYVLTGSTSSVTGEGTYQSGTAIQLSGEPTRTGYRFVGWRDSTGQTRNHSTNFMVIQNSVLTAQWTPIPITITYAMNSGTSSRPTQSDLSYLSTFSVAKRPTRAGYTFDGWSDGTQTYAEDQIYVVGTSNITLTAQWTAISYTVTYDLGGGQLGTVPTQANRTIGQTFTTSNSTPTKFAYQFSKWSDGTNAYDANSTYAMGAGNVTLTAQFIQNGYTSITYLPNNGIGTTPTNDAQLEGTTFTVADGSTLTRTGYVFTGWSDGTNTYQPDAVYSVGSYLNPITLTAQWTAVFNVTYSPGTGSGTPPIDLGSYRTGDAFEIAAEIDVTKSGYTFAGWSDGTRTYQPSAVYTVGTSNVTFTAQWTQVSSLSSPDPVQQSKIVSLSPTSAGIGTQNLIMIFGTFIEKVSNIHINGIPLQSGSWTQSSTAVSFVLPSNKIGTYQIQIYNGAAPVLPVQNFTVTTTATTTAATSSPSPSPTPSPSASPAPTPKPSVIPTPSPSPTPTKTNAQPTSQMVKVGTVYMASGTYFLNDATKVTLRAIAIKINSSEAKNILVYGHADNRGGVNNTVLSQNRAKAVADYLRPLLKSKNISIGWYSSSKPAVAGTSASALALNRRVEVYTR